MSEPYRTETVDTEAGEYTIELHYEDDPSNPLTDWDHPGMGFFVVGNRDGEMANTLDEVRDPAGNALRTWIANEHHVTDIERRFALWRAITGSPWILVTGSGYDMREAYGWMALVDGREDFGPDGPVAAIKVTMDTFNRAINGEFCGFIVKDPAGNDVDSLWDIDDEDYALQEARDNIAYYVNERLTAANLAGAGFIGIL